MKSTRPTPSFYWSDSAHPDRTITTRFMASTDSGGELFDPVRDEFRSNRVHVGQLIKCRQDVAFAVGFDHQANRNKGGFRTGLLDHGGDAHRMLAQDATDPRKDSRLIAER